MNDPKRLKVTFFPVAEHYAFAAEEVQKRKGVRQGTWVTIISYYYYLHVIMVPAILIYFGKYILAAVSFLTSLLVGFAYSKFAGAGGYADFYRQWFAKDPEEVHVELLEDGVRTSCEVCTSLYKWESVYEIQPKDDSLCFFTKDCGIAIPKTAFESQEQLADFLDFARSKSSSK